MSKAANSLKTSDVITTPIKLKYTSSFTATTALTGSGIEIVRGVNGPVTITGSVSQETLNYRSARHLFYSNFLTSSYLVSASSLDNSLQSTAASGTLDADVRYFPTESGAQITILSIPRKIYGEQISRKGFRVTSSVYYLVDDGNGNIVDSAASNKNVGNIIYSQGIVIITNPDYLTVFDTVPPGFLSITNNSIDVTVTDAYITNGSGSNYYAVFYTGSALPLLPGQSGSFTVNGSGASNLTVVYSSNSGNASITGSCNSNVVSSSITTSSSSIAINLNCSLPIQSGNTYTVSVKQAPTYSLGQSILGGTVAYIYQPGDQGYDANMQHGLIIAPANVATDISWSIGSPTNCGTYAVFPPVTGSDIGTGLSNTNKVVAIYGSGSYGAYIARNYTGSGYTDWFLPSYTEFMRMRANWAVIPNFPLTSGNRYWTSTEAFTDAINTAWFLFGSGSSSASTSKSSAFTHNIRPARYF